ncbi:MAG: universal stress protein [Ignavibacteriaceae bacterium]|nr:universal stress protein [Ignavibacteriaceae bacterium]HRI47096.1 universal stress protein [Ignavibacteriaceae bacterium]
MVYPINKILVPIDFSEYSKPAISFSKDLAKIFNSELILVHVVEPILYPPDFSMGQVALPPLTIDVDSAAKEELERLIKNEIGDEFKTSSLIRTGKPFVEIVDAAIELDIDLIVISSHGRTGVEHILFGSTADKVVQKAPCPVLTVRDPLKGFKYRESK